MANPRVLVNRRKAVRNIRKITRTMQLIATARFQKVLARAVASRPYAERITALVEELSAAGEQVDHPLLRENPEAGRSALLVLTANRGMCGGFNSSLLRLTGERITGETGAGRPVDLHVVGKKGVSYFRFLKQEMARGVTDFPDTPQFADVEPFAEQFMQAYSEGRYSAVQVVYAKFVSVAKQVPTCIQLLPIRRDEGEGAAQTRHGAEVQYDFSPAPAELLAELLPLTVKVRLYQCFMDNTVSEQVARMVAMKAATDAADDMIKLLSRQYNRARQSLITNDLLDIIGGAEALK